MKVNKNSKMRLVALCVETHLKKSYKTEEETDKYQKIKDEGQSPSSYPSEKYQMVPDHSRTAPRYTTYRGCARSICNSYFSRKHFKNPSVFQNEKL